MALVTPDFSESQIYLPLPDGTYPCRIIGYERTESKATPPTRYLRWKLSVIDSELHNGKAIYHGTAVEGKAAWVLKIFLVAADPDYRSGPFDPDTFVGKMVEVSIQTPPDSKYAQVKKVASYFQKGSLADAFP